MSSTPSKSDGSYTVVARRYRPQAFEDLVGQSHVVTALGNAIRQNRVGHAYLFTGARGVGKTSAARIFAKCLNCKKGPAPTPCNECDICRLVSTGEDIDVIEIDGASNRGIDEIRELRSNAGVRPSRSKYKIYIIDEVHMLTREAFNALLKTLEEPPGHVKFLFCTTDPQKIPVTVLSRCQRYDFLPVESANIAARLTEITVNEGVEAEPAALALLARRAGGSMRDSQSLLEQLLSYSDGSISVSDVNALLGTADLSCVAGIVEAMAGNEPGAALAGIHQAMVGGADASRFAQQMVGYVRDLMAINAGCDADVLLQITDDDIARAQALSQSMGMERLLSALQILDAAVVRMQSSQHARILLEGAVVRAATLQNVQSIPELLSAVGNSKGTSSVRPGPVSKVAATAPVQSAPAEPKKKPLDRPIEQPDAGDSVGPFSDGAVAIATKPVNVRESWEQLITSLRTDGDMIADMIHDFIRVEAPQDDLVLVTLKREYDCQLCSDATRKKRLETAFSGVAGRECRLEFRFDEATPSSQLPQAPRMTRVQQIRMLEKNPLVRDVMERFDAEVTDVEQLRPSRTG